MNIKIKYIFVITLICFFSVVVAQETNSFEKVPKQYSFEAGFRSISTTNFDSLSSLGYCGLIDYAWQLSGLNNKKAVYLSVTLGYSILPATSTTLDSRILQYGWAVRHNLAKNKKIIPFIGYALFLNNLKFNDIDGNIYGHQTKFDVGADYQVNDKISFFAKLEYSMSYYGTLGVSKRKSIYSPEFKIGFRFSKKQS